MRLHILALVAISFAASGSTAFATVELRSRMAELARDILAVTKQQPVRIGLFTGTGLPNSNSGPGIEQLLKESLESLSKGSLKDDAQIEVKGDYLLVPSKKNPGLKVVRVKPRIVMLDSGDELDSKSIDIELDGNNTIAEILQVTASLDPHGTKESRNKEIEKAAKSPSVHIHGPMQTLVSSRPGSPYSVELLVKPLKDHATTMAQPRKADDEKGLAFVKIDQNELYEIKIYNSSKEEVAVAVSIDDLDVFHFTEDRTDGRPNYTNYIVPRESETVIQGWHKSIHGNENVLSFLVTGYGQGAASKAGVTARGKVGVIHVQFAACSPLAPGAKSANETGFGPPIKVEQKVVTYDIKPPHDFVSIRYSR